MAPPVVTGAVLGREQDVSRLHELRRAAAAGRGTLALITGEAGIGKSRLLAEFLRTQTGGKAPLIAIAECLERAPRPFGPFRHLLRELARAAPWVTQTATLGRDALQMLAQDATVSVAREGQLDKADFFAGIHAVLGAISDKRATLLVVEDLHWADSATLEVFEYLAPRIARNRLMIVVTLRDDVLLDGAALSGTITRLERMRTVNVIPLGPLDQPLVGRLLKNALRGRPAPPQDVLDDIGRRCDGNPLFAEELLRNWLERNARQHELPRSVIGLVNERVSLLDERGRRTLVYAAVLGRRFDPAMLATLLECTVDQLADGLQRARDLNLVVEDEHHTGFRFRHALTRQALYESVLAMTVRPLHARIARMLESQPDASQRVDDLAYHWWQAQVPSKAREYNDRAAAAALALSAYADATTYLERSLSLCVQPLDRARLMSDIGAAQRADGNSEAALRWCLAATESFAAAGEPDLAIAPLMFACAELSNAGRVDEAIANLTAFADAQGDRLAPSSASRLEAETFLCEVMHVDRDVREVVSRFEHLEHAHDAEARARYWTARSTAHAYAGQSTAWSGALEELYRSVSEPSVRVLVRSSALNFAALGALHLGRHADVDRALNSSRATSREHGFHSLSAYAEAVTALDRYLRGDLEEARVAAARAADRARFETMRALLGCAGPLIGLALGDEALIDATLFEEAGRAVLASGIVRPGDVAAGAVAAVLIDRNELPEARRILEAAVRSAALFVDGQLIWPLAARHVDASHMRILTRRLSAFAEEREHVVARTVADLVAAIAAERAGDGAARRSKAAQAVAGFHALGWPLFEAQALELLDRVADARAIYEHCGSVSDLRRLGVAATAGIPADRYSAITLSPREAQVAGLVAEGLANRAIADRLAIREKTVETHLSAIYVKLKLHSRTQLASHIVRERARVEPRAGAR